MADLIALLMLALGTQLKSGVSESKLEKELAAIVLKEQPAPLDEVKVDASGVSASGCDSITFDFKKLTMDPLVLRSASITVKKVKKASDGKLSIAGIQWSSDIGESELTEALQSQVDKLKDTTISIAADGLTLTGKYPVIFGSKVSYSVTGDLSMEDETLLMFHIDKSKVSGVGLPKGLNKTIEKEVNPVYDLRKFKAKSQKEIQLAKDKLNYDFELKIVDIKPMDGHIIVSGKA
ncbi:hypothetical protein IT575_12430 [bacterium]|nr:hypothetical protein [bacterium]